jgi:hypothetical protein
MRYETICEFDFFDNKVFFFAFMMILMLQDSPNGLKILWIICHKGFLII